MRFPLFFRSLRARTNSGVVPSETSVSPSSQRAARAILPAVLALGALSLGVLGLRAQNSAPPTIAVSRHALNNGGRIEGSAQQLLGESINLNGGAFFGGDLKVPGTPRVQVNGQPNWRGQSSGGGSSSPSNYSVNINGNVTLRSLVRQSDPIALDNVATPPNPSGTRSVNINNARDVAAVGAWNTVRDLNLNGGAPDVSVPAGTYGNFNVNGGALVLGTPNDNSPDIYNFQSLNFNAGSRLKCVGPIVVVVRSGLNVNSVLGSSENQAWLQLNISNGGLNLNSNAVIYGSVRAPNGSVNVNGTIYGSVQADSLTVNNGGAIKLATIVLPTPIPTPLPTATPVPTATPKPTPTATPVPTAVPVPTPTGAPLATVTPILECVENLGGGQYRAHFGTNVPGTQAQIIPVGSTAGNENKFAPGPIDRDQPTSFLPGRTRDSFQVAFTGSNLTWTLRGGTVTASANSNGCPVPAPTPTVVPTATPTATPIPAPTATPIPAPTATPIPAPTATPIPAPTATLTPILNQPPVGVDDAQFVKRNGSVRFELLGVDDEGDDLTYQIVSGPTNGTVTPVAGSTTVFTYAPNRNFVGDDILQFVVGDGHSQSDPATVLFIVQASNTAPKGAPDAYTTDEDTTLSVGAPGVLANDSDAEGDALSAVLEDSTTHGRLTLRRDGSFTYLPDANFNGQDSFNYRVSDGSLQSAIVRASITVKAVNDAPVANSQSLNVDEDNSIAFTLTGSDVDGDALTFDTVASPQHGTISGKIPNLVYQPAKGFFGEDSLKFIAFDGKIVSNRATITFTVKHVNHAPVAVADAYATDEDTPLTINAPGVLSNDSDTDVGDVLSAVLVSAPAHGTLSLQSNGAFGYAPNPDYNGSDSFTYQPRDNANPALSGAPVTVSLTVNPVNDAPVAIDGTETIDQRTSIGSFLNGSDVDDLSYTLKYILVEGAHLGTVTISKTNGTYNYTPNPGALGTDSFTFRAVDPHGAVSANIATQTINIVRPTNAPVARDDAFTVVNNQALYGNVLTNDNGTVNPDLTAVLETNVAHGTLQLLPDGRLTYFAGPDENGDLYVGTDSFTYHAQDGAGATSLPATVTITVTQRNRAPIAVDDAYSTDEDVELTILAPGILANDTDADGDTLRKWNNTLPQHGRLIANNDGSFIYTPEANFNGQDSFTYTVKDATEISRDATVTITVRPINDAPIATDFDGGEIQQSATRNGALLASDVDDAPANLTFAAVDAPAHGLLNLNANGTFSYRPTPGTLYTGPDSFTFRARDAGGLQSNIARASFTIAAAPSALVARDDSYSTTDGDQATISGQNVLTNDGGNGPLTAVLVDRPTKGTLTFNADGSFKYVSTDGLVSEDSFTYRAVDVKGATSNVAPAKLTITHVNHAVYATTDVYSIGAVGTLRVGAPGVLGNDNDVDLYAYGDKYGDKLSAALLPGSGPNFGTVNLRADGSFDYTLTALPPAQETGDSFYYTVSDGLGQQATARVNIRFQFSNNAPIAQSQSLLTQNNDVLPLTLSGTDADGDKLYYEILTLPKHGQLLSRNGYEVGIGRTSSPLVDYQPANLSADSSPTDSFTFRVRDARSAYSDATTISIRRGQNNGVPAAVADEATSTGFSVTIPVLLNDSDPNGDALRVISARGGQIGSTLTISADAQSITYNPGPNAYPPYDDSFIYTVGDAVGATATARVTVHLVQYGGVDGIISSLNGFNGYFGDGVTNGDASGQTAGGTTSSPGNNYPGAAAYGITLRNTGPSPDSFVVRGPAFEPGATATTAHWSARYFSGSSSSGADVDITAQVTSAAGWTSPVTDNAGATRKLRVEVRPDATIANGATLKTLFDIRSARDSSARDVVGAITTKGAATPGG